MSTYFVYSKQEGKFSGLKFWTIKVFYTIVFCKEDYSGQKIVFTCLSHFSFDVKAFKGVSCSFSYWNYSELYLVLVQIKPLISNKFRAHCRWMCFCTGSEIYVGVKAEVESSRKNFSNKVKLRNFSLPLYISHYGVFQKNVFSTIPLTKLLDIFVDFPIIFSTKTFFLSKNV